MKTCFKSRRYMLSISSSKGVTEVTVLQDNKGVKIENKIK